MGFNRGHFFSALAGLIVGVMLVAVLPAGADNGDPIYLGQANTAKSTTRISVNYGMVIRSFRADVPAATFKVSSGAPIAVNSTGLVEHLNADLLDGFDAANLIRSGYTSTDNAGNQNGDALTITITTPGPGYLLISASLDSKINVLSDEFGCLLQVDDVALPGTTRTIQLDRTSSGEDHTDECATDGATAVAKGAHTVDLHITDWDSALLGEASMWILFVPFGIDGKPPL